MKYELRHENNKVFSMEIGGGFGVNNIYKDNILTSHIPTGITFKNNIDLSVFNEWLKTRGISAIRKSVDYILNKENVKNVNELLVKNNALSLIDHYWICKENDHTKWEDINYFDNNKAFGKIGEDIYIGIRSEIVEKGQSASSSANGMQPKMWILLNNERWLLKIGEGIMKQEPFNEYTASILLEKMGINRIPYDILKRKDKIVSGCKNMLENNEELISAYFLYSGVKRGNNELGIDFHVRRCKELGLKDNTKDIRIELEKMIVTDYLFGNTDRHWNNFGVIRDCKTLEIKKLAPLFDHGACFFNNVTRNDMVEENKRLECKTFRSNHKDNLKLVNNIDWLNKDVLDEMPDIIYSIMKENKEEFNTIERINTICFCIKNRILDFKLHFGIKHKNWKETKNIIIKNENIKNIVEEGKIKENSKKTKKYKGY